MTLRVEERSRRVQRRQRTPGQRVLDSGWRVSTSCDVAAERRCCRVVTGSVHVIRNVAGYGY